MPAEKLSMKKIKEVLSLPYYAGLVYRVNAAKFSPNQLDNQAWPTLQAACVEYYL
jgi:hypothetical protein